MNARRGVPLRVTLVAALLALVAIGLLASGIATTTAMSDYLMQRTDAQLAEALGPFVRRSDLPSFPRPDSHGPRPPSRYYVAVVDAQGNTVQVLDNPAAPAQDIPDLTADAPTPAMQAHTVGSVAPNDLRWRLVSAPSPLSDGSTGQVVIATSLSDLDSTVDRLVLLQSAIGFAVLVLLGVLGYLVVRRSLRPLVEVETTAAAIADGDLHRRIPDAGTRTEVGRLSRALNGMLSQIQAAFTASAASEDAARQSEQRMRRFVGDASHELRTPLTTIRGFAELYRQGAASEPADVQRLMRRIEGEADRMGLLVEDLLLLARLDSQRPLEQEPVDLLTIAADTVHDAKAVAPQRSIQLEVQDGPDTPEVIGDEARLRQVLGNLVNNALQHTPPDSPSPFGSRRMPRASSWRSPTTDPDSPRRRRSGCSSGSTAPTPLAPGPVAAAGSACPSSPRSWPRTVEPSAWSAGRNTALPSGCCCLESTAEIRRARGCWR